DAVRPEIDPQVPAGGVVVGQHERALGVAADQQTALVERQGRAAQAAGHDGQAGRPSPPDLRGPGGAALPSAATCARQDPGAVEVTAQGPDDAEDERPQQAEDPQPDDVEGQLAHRASSMSSADRSGPRKLVSSWILSLIAPPR